MSTFSLSGSGTHALTASTTGLQVTITTPSSVQGVGRANPANHYHTGMVRFSDGTAYWDPVPITGGPQFIPVPQNATSFGYAMQGGAVVSITEVIGGTVFFSGGGSAALSGLTDVLVASPTDGQLLQWNTSAGKWENATPAAGTITTANATLGTNVNCPTTNAWVDVLTLSLAAGTWLLSYTIVTRGDGTPRAWGSRVWDGTSTYYAVSETVGTFTQTLYGTAIVVLGSTTTIHLSLVTNLGNSGFGARPNLNDDFTTGNVGTQINGVKVA